MLHENLIVYIQILMDLESMVLTFNISEDDNLWLPTNEVLTVIILSLSNFCIAIIEGYSALVDGVFFQGRGGVWFWLKGTCQLWRYLVMAGGVFGHALSDWHPMDTNIN